MARPRRKAGVPSTVPWLKAAHTPGFQFFLGVRCFAYARVWHPDCGFATTALKLLRHAVVGGAGCRHGRAIPRAHDGVERASIRAEALGRLTSARWNLARLFHSRLTYAPRTESDCDHDAVNSNAGTRVLRPRHDAHPPLRT